MRPPGVIAGLKAVYVLDVLDISRTGPSKARMRQGHAEKRHRKTSVAYLYEVRPAIDRHKFERDRMARLLHLPAKSRFNA